MTQPAATPTSTDDTPVLIYAGGLGSYPANTADGVTDVIAAVVDRRCDGTFRSSSIATVTAPKALKLGKAVTDEAGNPLLHVFELEYRDVLLSATSQAGPPPSPGVVRSAFIALRATGMFTQAVFRPAKSAKAKFQLAYALVILCVLVLAGIITVVSGMVAAGVSLPGWIEGIFDGVDATKTVVTVGGITVLSWSATRRWLLATASTTQHTIRYIDNDDRHRDTVANRVDDAVDGLRDNGWTGPIHLLGYSMGSLVLYDALFPRRASLRSGFAAGTFASLVTIGCPHDAVRLFRPGYVQDRSSGPEALTWRNVYQAADVFGSNFEDDTDGDEDVPPTKPRSRRRTRPGDALDVRPSSSDRYLDDELGFIASLSMYGFRSHAGYWGGTDEGNCFRDLVGIWLPNLKLRDEEVARPSM